MNTLIIMIITFGIRSVMCLFLSLFSMFTYRERHGTTFVYCFAAAPPPKTTTTTNNNKHNKKTPSYCEALRAFVRICKDL